MWEDGWLNSYVEPKTVRIYASSTNLAHHPLLIPGFFLIRVLVELPPPMTSYTSRILSQDYIAITIHLPMIAKLFVLACLLCWPLIGSGQSSATDSIQLYRAKYVGTYRPDIERKLEFLPFIDDGFLPATLYFRKGSVQLELRYNTARDEMEFLEDGDLYFIDNKHEIDSLRLGDRFFRMGIVLAEDTPARLGYLERIETGRVALLQHHRTQLKDNLDRNQVYTDGIPERYTEAEDHYYLQYPGQQLLRLPTQSKGQLYKALEALPAEVTETAKKAKVRANAKGFRALVRALNGV